MTPLRSILVVSALVAAMGGSALANPIDFDRSWREQGFFRFWSNDYAFLGDRLDVVSDGTVSLVWRAVEPALGNATRARWNWNVRESVVATDLQKKGGDDRNLAVYFVFVDPETARGLTRNTARRLLRNPNTRALVYVWGGERASNDFLQSPYHPKLATHVLRPAGTGNFMEGVDLAADFRSAFGEQRGVLVGLGISADSDDTDGRIVASVDSFELLNR